MVNWLYAVTLDVDRRIEEMYVGSRGPRWLSHTW